MCRLLLLTSVVQQRNHRSVRGSAGVAGPDVHPSWQQYRSPRTLPGRHPVMQKFRIRNLQLLVATDVAARGLDVDDLTHVINYGLPDDTESYTHRLSLIHI